MDFTLDNDNKISNDIVIKVVGVGGGGGNAVNRMIEDGLDNVEFVTINTDQQVLKTSKAQYKIQIGAKLTHGQGAGGNPEQGSASAEESREQISSVLKGSHLVFVTAGMGGGTGTGAAPVVSEIAREMGILTVGVVTKPFAFEGKRRTENAEKGIQELAKHVDSLVIIPNERLKLVSEQKLSLLNAFKAADDILRLGIQSIADIINKQGIVNLDFADLSSVMREAGYAHMGVGHAAGKERAKDAALAAISSPLLETSIDGARGIIINITASVDVGLDEATSATSMISDAAHPDANIFWGLVLNPDYEDEMEITVIATGFDNNINRTTPGASSNDMFLGFEAPSEPLNNDLNFDDVLGMFKK